MGYFTLHFWRLGFEAHRKGRFDLNVPRTGNLPSAFKQLSSNSFRTGKNRRAGPKIFVS
jgi:hypothetical protein